MHTQIALKIYALKKMNVIKSNAFFWNNFSRIESIENMQIDTKKYEQEINQKKLNLVWIFDENFPKIQTQLSKSERPYFFAYKGDLNLLNQLHKNIAVIGSRRINQDIEEREKQIVQLLCEQDFNIVSGLAKGCDTIAHQISLEQNKKTIATLPCEIPDIYPPENINLANAIAQNGGLLISEYVTTPKTHLERKARFIERDRLQALFSNAVILIASQMRKNNGSKYAMQKAKEKGMVTIFNPAPAKKISDCILNSCDYFVVNQTETEFFTGIYPSDENSSLCAAKKLNESGVKTVIITLGAKGSCAIYDEKYIKIDDEKVNVVDTTAAGDTFVGAFAVKLAEGNSVESAMNFASKASALTVTKAGAQQSIPYLQELK